MGVIKVPSSFRGRPKKDESQKLLRHVSLQLLPDDYAKLEALASEHGHTISSMARYAIRSYLTAAFEDLPPPASSNYAKARGASQKEARK